MTPTKAVPLVFGLHPSRKGFGWVAFSGPFSVHDLGLVVARKNKNVISLRKLEKLLDRLNPEIIVLEDFPSGTGGRAARIVRLCQGILSIAAERSIEVAIYPKCDIRRCFGAVGAQSRQEIAEAVARSLSLLRHRLPSPRKAWQAEDERMALFCAAAVVLTHFQLGSSHLLDDLLEACENGSD